MGRSTAIGAPRSRAAIYRETTRWRAGLRVAWLLGVVLMAAPVGPGRARSADAPADGPLVSEHRVGLGGYYKVGSWTPIELTIQGGATKQAVKVALTTADGDGVECRVWAQGGRPIQLLPGRPAVVRGQVKFGRMDNTLTVSIFDQDDEPLVQQRFSSAQELLPGRHRQGLPATQQLLVCVGPPIGLEALLRQERRDDEFEEPARAIELADCSQLPTHWLGYDGIDWLVLSTSNPEIYRPLTSDSAQRRAIDDWIARGGKLLLAVGSQAPELLAPEGALAGLAPGRWVENYRLSLTGAIEEFSGTKQPLAAAAASDGFELQVPRLEVSDGVVVCREADLPLVVRQARGFGQVMFAGLDLNQSPLADWKGRTALLARLLDRPSNLADDDPLRRQGRVTWLGLTDLSAQLRGALDQFAGIELIPFAVVAGLILAYVALIGPVDYWVVTKVFRRPELTWLTFPLIVLVTCLGAYGYAVWKKGSSLRANQVDLVDVDLASGLVRGTSWANVFSPQASSFDVRFGPARAAGEPDPAAPTFQPRETLVSWFGLPGTGFGGMDALGVEGALGTDQYRASPKLDALIELPLQVWSTKSLVTRWTAEDPGLIAAALEAGTDEVPLGVITNRSPFTWENGLLACGRWGIAFRRPLEPGQSIDLLNDLVDLERTELVTRLTERVMVFDDTRKEYVRQARPYDQASFDRWQILKQMMFYEAAGGESYARLLNQYQAFVDLSAHLKAGRAILVVRAAPAAAELTLDGRPLSPQQLARDTYYRFVLPVSELSAGP